MGLLFCLSIDGNVKKLEYYDSFVLFTVLMCSDSILNWLKRVTHGSFLFLCKTLVFLFLPFLDLHAQIRSTQNWYTDCKPAGVFVGNLLEITSPLMPFENFVTLILCNKLIYYFYQ